LVIAILGFAATQPDTFRVQRTVSVKAAPEKIFPLVNDFHRYSEWSPFEKDPTMKRTYTGPLAGKGASYAWEGKQIGVGSMEIMEAVPASKVLVKLDFVKPFQAHNTAEFTMVPNGNSTSVTWAMNGHSTYLCKVMHLFFNMDSMLGKEFETGLANLKAIAEK
jgi:carbon monoxide dehydrogenase subunit G